MIQTYDELINSIRKTDSILNNILYNIHTKKIDKIEIKSTTLYFNFDDDTITISRYSGDEFIKYKSPDTKISFLNFIELLNKISK